MVPGRDIALDYGLRRNDGRALPDRVFRHAVNINLPLTELPSYLGIERAEAALDQFEVIDPHAAVDIGTVEESFHTCRARCRPTELHGMEIDKVEDITHIDIGERGCQRVTVTVRPHPRDQDTLCAPGDEEVVHLQVVPAVEDGSGMDRIERVADM